MFEGFRKRLGFTRSGTVVNPQTQAFLKGMDLEDGPDNSRVISPYGQNIAVYRSICIIASALSRIDLYVMRGNTIMTTGPFVELMKKPNPVQNKNEFLSAIVTQLNVYGNAYILVDETDSRGIPRALIPVPGNVITPVRGKYVYELDGWEIKLDHKRSIKLNIEDIIQIQYAPNPADPLVGVGPLEAAKITLETDQLAAIYNKTLLKSGGLPAGILSYAGPGRLTEEMKEEIRQSWQRTYGGARNAAKLAVTNADWKWQQTGSSQKEMEYIEARKWNLADIARAMNVPLLYLAEQEKSGLGDAGLKVLQELFYNENIVPLSDKISSALNESFFNRIDKKLSCRFDFSDVPVLREDLNRKVEAAEKLHKMGFSINNINKRLELGLDPEPWGDDAYLPVNMVPSIDIMNHEVSLPSSDKAPDQGDPQAPPTDQQTTDTKTTDTTSADTKTDPKKAKKAAWNDEASLALRAEARAVGKVRKSFMKQRPRILSNLDKIDRDHKSTFEINDITESIIPVIISLYSETARDVLSRRGEVSDEMITQISNQAIAYAQSRYENILRVCRELVELIEEESEKSIAAGEDLESVKNWIRKVFNTSINESEELVKIEIFNCYNSARVFAFKQMDIYELEWVSRYICRNHSKAFTEQEIEQKCDCVVVE